MVHVRSNHGSNLLLQLLTVFQDEVQSCESFQEFLDVMGESYDLYINHVTPPRSDMTPFVEIVRYT